MKRKIIALCLGVTLAFGMVACGNNEEKRAGDQKQAQDGTNHAEGRHILIAYFSVPEDYPSDHDPLVDQAADEQDENARPELKNHIEDLGQYDTVILGFPNWWADLPMPVYTFLEEYDFSGKTIIPFVTHGGSGFSGTRDAISELEPDAEVSDQALSLSRGDVADSEEQIRQWAGSLR